MTTGACLVRCGWMSNHQAGFEQRGCRLMIISENWCGVLVED